MQRGKEYDHMCNVYNTINNDLTIENEIMETITNVKLKNIIIKNYSKKITLCKRRYI